MTAVRSSAALFAGCLLLVSCGVSPQRSPEPVPPERLPAATPGPSEGLAQGRIWVARKESVVPVFVALPARGLNGRLRALLALGEPGQTLPTAIPQGTRLLRIVRQADEVVRLDLSEQLLTADQTAVPLALAQLVLTATEEAGVVRVLVHAGGEPVTLRDDSSRPLRRPLQRDDVAVYVQGQLERD